VLEGDTKSIESLFQTPEHTHYEDPLWIELKNKFRHVFLTKQAINKYMIEVMGNKGNINIINVHLQSLTNENIQVKEWCSKCTKKSVS
jgi:hypothetical protein